MIKVRLVVDTGCCHEKYKDVEVEEIDEGTLKVMLDLMVSEYVSSYWEIIEDGENSK